MKLLKYDLVAYVWSNLFVIFFFCRAKLKNHEYETLDQLEADLNLMFENAKRYNVPNSAIYKRVLKMQQVMQVSAIEQSKGCNFSYEFISPAIFFQTNF